MVLVGNWLLCLKVRIFRFEEMTFVLVKAYQITEKSVDELPR
jgi:hypothetical protein